MNDLLSDLLSYFVVVAISYVLGLVHGATWYKRFIERKANVKIIDTTTVTIVPKEPPCPPPTKP